MTSAPRPAEPASPSATRAVRPAVQVAFAPDPAVPADGAVVVHDPAGAADADGLLAAAGALGLDGEPATARLAVVVDGRAAIREVAVVRVPFARALPALLAVPARGGPAWRRVPDSVAAWSLAARIATGVVAAQRVMPALVRDDDGGIVGVWRAAADDPDTRAALARLAGALPRAASAVARDDDAVWEPLALLGAFCDAVADLAVRHGGPAPSSGRPRARVLPWTARWAEALADPADPAVPLREDEADELVAGVDGWLASLSGAGTGGDVVELRLRAPAEQDGEWVLDLGVRTAEGVARGAADVWAAAGSDPEAGAVQEALLAGLGRCARVFPPLDAALRESTPERVVLDLGEAWTFISQAAPLLAEVGVAVALPDELASGDLRLRLRVGAGGPDGGQAEGGEAAGTEPDGDAPDDGEAAGVRLSGSGPDASGDDGLWDDIDALPGLVREGGGGGSDLLGGLLAAFRWEVALGDDTLSEDEFAALVASKAPLVRWRDRWVRVDPDAVERFSHVGGEGRLPLAEALSLALAGSDAAAPTDDAGPGAPVDVVADGGVAVLLERLRAATDRPPAPTTPDGFTGELRGYQRRGVAWLAGMASLGLGAVLADDMGLGKTVQLIAFLLGREGTGPHLVVCPTSVVGNWEREILRFAPTLTVHRHHGPERAAELDDVAGVVLTTYGTLRRDVELLAGVDWDVVTLDEAQHVKNPTTAGARAVRRLRRRQLLALTGTPLENRLTELWSLLEVTNPGLLGSRSRFAKRFATPIEKHRDSGAAARLRRLVAPFVLRREKTDPTVSSDLPDKIERTVACSLTPEQASLYQAAVDRALSADGDGVAGASAMQRRGRILALLTELKQICNHPAQYLGEPPGTSDLIGRSGKLAAAREIIREAADAGDAVLLFTQYVTMGRLLVAQLGADLGTDVPFLHGGVPAGGRDKLVARFQDGEAPVLVVSLRAGGTGLNLTAATHVLHYDRWWNPAVEDQATDRAHRIGQTRTVEVHKLVTAGTLEERVAEVLSGKRALADSVVGAGEAWITELGDAELRELVALSDDATVEDLDEDLDDWAEPSLAGSR